MSEKDVLGKADALLRRHGATGSETGAFPVLTDLIQDPGETGDIAREVFTRVMAEVEARLTVDFEQRLADQLVPLIHASVAATVGDLRQELANAIGDAVAAALERRNLK